MAMIIEPDNISVLKARRDIAAVAGNAEEAERMALRVVAIDPADEEGVEAAVRLLMINGKDDAAANLIDSALKRKPDSMSLLITKKEFHLSKENYGAVIEVCKRILALQPDNTIVRNDLAEAYASSGDVNAASRMYLELGVKDDKVDKKYLETPKPQKPKVPDTTKRYAERVLRRAYISKLTLSDPDLVSSMGFDDATLTAIMNYLSDISEYGDITQGTLEFERMEKLSLNAVTKGNCTGMEEDFLISIPCAYIAGAAKDADEAKLLVAYMHKVLSSRKSARVLPPELRKIAEATPKGTSVEDIMKNSKIGVYQAKMVKDSL
jgi:tetratricopeptide (TPR) repeat protein